MSSIPHSGPDSAPSPAQFNALGRQFEGLGKVDQAMLDTLDGTERPAGDLDLEGALAADAVDPREADRAHRRARGRQAGHRPGGWRGRRTAGAREGARVQASLGRGLPGQRRGGDRRREEGRLDVRRAHRGVDRGAEGGRAGDVRRRHRGAAVGRIRIGRDRGVDADAGGAEVDAGRAVAREGGEVPARVDRGDGDHAVPAAGAAVRALVVRGEVVGHVVVGGRVPRRGDEEDVRVAAAVDRV